MQKNDNDSDQSSAPNDVHITRRENLLRLLREFSQARIASGEPTNGTEKAFAEQLQMSKSLLSQLKTSRPISDANAKQIEARCKKPSNWLSEIHDALVQRATPGEEAFVALARASFRATDKEGRARLKHLIVEASRTIAKAQR